MLAAWRLRSARMCDLPSHVSIAAVDAERARGDKQRHAICARVTASEAVGVVAGGAEHGRAIPASNSERSSRGSLHLAPAVHHCAARLNPPSERNQCTCCERLRYSQKVPFGWRHSAEHGACRRQGAARWRGHTRPCEVHWSLVPCLNEKIAQTERARRHARDMHTVHTSLSSCIMARMHGRARSS